MIWLYGHLVIGLLLVVVLYWRFEFVPGTAWLKIVISAILLILLWPLILVSMP